MGVLDKVTKMRQEGMSDPMIVQTLRKDKVPPKDIQDAFSQSTIKSAIGASTEENNSYTASEQTLPYENENYQNQQYPNQDSGGYFPTYQDNQQPEQAYQNYQEYQPQSMDAGTINDIAEQVVIERVEELKKKMYEFNRFKEEAEAEIQRTNKRLDNLENNFNSLQAAILKKIGDYGDDLKDISKEIHATQESFSKILDPLTDNIKEARDSKKRN
jgi:hypothetical protein